MGFAHLFAVKLCFTVAAQKLFAAMPPVTEDESGGKAAESFAMVAGKVELFRK